MMKLLDSKIDILRQSRQNIMTESTTKVRRKLFDDSPPINNTSLKNDVKRILAEDFERFKMKYNFDFDTNKPLQGPWEWECKEEAPSFYVQPYPVKTTESLRNRLMACTKNRDQCLRNRTNNNNLHHNFQSLATILEPSVDIEKKGTEGGSLSGNLQSGLLETPSKDNTKNTLSLRSTSQCGTKRKINSSHDDIYLDCNNGMKDVENNRLVAQQNKSPSSFSSSTSIPSFSSPSPLRSSFHSSSETLRKLSSQSQDDLQNVHTTTTTTDTDYSSPQQTTTLSPSLSSSPSSSSSSLLAQGKLLRQTNINEFMKSQKSASSGHVAKKARCL